MASINLQDGEEARLKITKEQEDEISKLYHQAYLELKKQMEALPLHEGATTSQSLRKTYLNKLTKQLKASYQSLGVGLEKQIKKGMGDTAQAVVHANDDWLKKAGLKIEGAYSYVPRDIVSILSSGKLYGGGWTLSKAIWGDSQKKAHDIDQIVAIGVAENKSAYEIAKDLEKYVNPAAKKDWDWNKVYPGTSKKVDYNAQRLARTMVSHAYQQSLLATTKYNPFVTGYRWRAAAVERTCEICMERDGQLYSANDLPLDHPNGMCTFIAELSDNLTQVADRLGDWANGKEDPALDKWYQSMTRKSTRGSLLKTTTPLEKIKAMPTTTLTDNSKNLLKRYTGGYYDIPNEMAKYIVDGKTLDDFVKSRVSPTFSYEQAMARYEPMFEGVQNILRVIDSSPKFETLTRVSLYEKSPPSVGDSITWGMRSTSQASSFEDKALLGKLKGMEFMGEDRRDAIIYKIQDSPGLDIEKYSSYKSQKEVLISGTFEVSKVEDPIQIGTHSSTVVWLKYKGENG